MRAVIGMGALAAALTAAATLTWVDVLDDQSTAAAVPAAPRYTPPRVEIAEGADVGEAEVTAYVEQLVNDPRGWRSNLDGLTLRIVPPGIGGTQRMPGHIGMAYPSERLALVTDEAWTEVGPKFASIGGTLDDQRTWIVLHELGHLLGHPHQECPGPGQPAPVMRATTYHIGACALNVWPNP